MPRSSPDLLHHRAPGPESVPASCHPEARAVIRQPPERPGQGGGSDLSGRDESRHGADPGRLNVSVSLQGHRDGDVVAYRGKENTPLVDLKKVDHYDIDRFWDAIPSRPDGRLILNPSDFYILASRERVRVPPQYAAEMVPFDPWVGEFRIHDAGFFDPRVRLRGPEHHGHARGPGGPGAGDPVRNRARTGRRPSMSTAVCSTCRRRSTESLSAHPTSARSWR